MTSDEALVDVILRCRNRWPVLFHRLAPDAQTLKDAMESGPDFGVCCPVHGLDPPDEFRVNADFAEWGGARCGHCGVFASGFPLLGALRGWDADVACRELAEALETVQVQAPTETDLRAIWASSLRLAEPECLPARKFLASRLGLESEALSAGDPLLRLASLRFRPRLACADARQVEAVTFHPALVAYVEDASSKLVALSVTYLDAAGSLASVPQPEAFIAARGASFSGASVRLRDGPLTLQIAVGLESAVAIALRNSHHPIWCVLSARTLATMSIPSSVHHVVIWCNGHGIDERPRGADRRSGTDAGLRLARRLAERDISYEIRVPVSHPAHDRVTWGDIAREQGLQAIPILPERVPRFPNVRMLLRRRRTQRFGR